MPNSLAQSHKEAIAKEIVRLIRLIPSAPSGIAFSTFTTDPQETLAAILSEQNMQTLYLKIFDIALSHLDDSYQQGTSERFSAAVDIVELVKEKWSGNA